jgi:hypothetical protein
MFVPWTEAADMEHGVEIQVEGELETIVKVSDPFEDFVWAKLLGSKLRHFLVDLDILSRKPDPISNLKDVGCTFVLFKLFLHPFLE